MAQPNPKTWTGGSPIPISDYLDSELCNDVGAIIVRDQQAWTCLDPGTPGQLLTTQGSSGPPYWGSGGTAYLAPAFTSFSVGGVSSPLEVGAAIPAGTYAFNWATTNPGNVQANSISITDVTGSATLASGLANTGSTNITLAAIAPSTAASQVWRVNGINSQGGGFSRTFSVAWLFRVYLGTNMAPDLNANQVKSLSDFSGLQGSFSGTYTYADSLGFKFASWPDQMGGAVSFVDASTGFPVSMADATDDPFYSNVDHGWSYGIVNIANTYGISTPYRLYRSSYSYQGVFTIRIS